MTDDNDDDNDEHPLNQEKKSNQHNGDETVQSFQMQLCRRCNERHLSTAKRYNY